MVCKTRAEHLPDIEKDEKCTEDLQPAANAALFDMDDRVWGSQLLTLRVIHSG